jgi:hypothetical protein
VKTYWKDNKELSYLLDGLDEFDTFEEIHGCEFAHGQYSVVQTRGEMLDLYLNDFYPDCKVDYE